MTHTRPRTIAPPALTPTQTPETLDWMVDALQVKIHSSPRRLIPGQPDDDRSATNALLLIPGQVGEITVQVQNTGSQPLVWWVEISGDMPSTGFSCLLSESIGSELPAQDRVQTSVCFDVPADFFEDPAALTPDRRVLQANYESQISVYVERQGTAYLVGHQTFYLAVRSPSTYLDFLPDIYREFDFMGRFLLIFEQAFDPAVQTLDTLWAYLDPLTAPVGLLPFLAHWVAWRMEPRWPLQQQRRLIRHAVELYRWRGTKQGLRFFLHLYTDLPLDEHLPELEKHISITEDFNRVFVLGDLRLDQNLMLGGGRPYHFTVTLRCQENDHNNHINRALVEEIIEQYKPAFCTYDLQFSNATENGLG